MVEYTDDELAPLGLLLQEHYGIAFDSETVRRWFVNGVTSAEGGVCRESPIISKHRALRAPLSECPLLLTADFISVQYIARWRLAIGR